VNPDIPGSHDLGIDRSVRGELDVAATGNRYAGIVGLHVLAADIARAGDRYIDRIRGARQGQIARSGNFGIQRGGADPGHPDIAGSGDTQFGRFASHRIDVQIARPGQLGAFQRGCAEIDRGPLAVAHGETAVFPTDLYFVAGNLVAQLFDRVGVPFGADREFTRGEDDIVRSGEGYTGKFARVAGAGTDRYAVGKIAASGGRCSVADSFGDRTFASREHQ